MPGGNAHTVVAVSPADQIVKGMKMPAILPGPAIPSAAAASTVLKVSYWSMGKTVG